MAEDPVCKCGNETPSRIWGQEWWKCSYCGRRGVDPEDGEATDATSPNPGCLPVLMVLTILAIIAIIGGAA